MKKRTILIIALVLFVVLVIVAGLITCYFMGKHKINNTISEININISNKKATITKYEETIEELESTIEHAYNSHTLNRNFIVVIERLKEMNGDASICNFVYEFKGIYRTYCYNNEGKSKEEYDQIISDLEREIDEVAKESRDCVSKENTLKTSIEAHKSEIKKMQTQIKELKKKKDNIIDCIRYVLK